MEQNTQALKYNSLIHAAVGSRNIKIVQLFIDYYIKYGLGNVNAAHPEEKLTPYELAMKNGDSEIAKLIKYASDLFDKNTLFVKATIDSDINEMEKFLEEGIDPNTIYYDNSIIPEKIKSALH